MAFNGPAGAQNIEIHDRPFQILDFFRYGLQTKIFIATWIGYATFYLTRKSLTYALPGLMTELHYDTAQMGLLGSVLSLTYGVSKLISGILSDRYSPKWIMIIGLLMTGVANVLLGLSSALTIIVLLWAVNGLFQGTGAPVCAHYLVNYFPKKSRGTWWSLWNTSHNAGGAIIPIIAGISLTYYTWRSALILPGVVAIIVSIYLFWGLPKSTQNTINRNESKKNKSQLIQDLKLMLPLWHVFGAYFLVYILRNGVGDWIHIYLIQTKNWDALRANGVISWFEIGGFIGGIASGIFSDYIFKGLRLRPCFGLILGFFLAFLPLILFKNILDKYYLMEFCIFLQGFFIFGPHTLLGMSIAEHAGKKLAASATGLAGFLGYIGAAISGLPLGMIIKYWGWTGHFLLMLIIPIFILILMKFHNER